MYYTTLTVKGAGRAHYRLFDTIEDAETRAEQWRRSNSTGDYIAKVDSVDDALIAMTTEVLDIAEWRGHGTEYKHELIKPTLLRVTCPTCGAEADVNTRPLPNQTDVSGPLVAIGCHPKEDQ